MNPDKPIEEFERLSALALERLPGLEIVCTCPRLGEQADRARLIAVGRTRHALYRSAEREIHSMVDRIGSGDAFAAGVLHSRLCGQPVERALDFGLAAAALKHSVVGDVNRVSEAEVTECLSGAAAALIRR